MSISDTEQRVIDQARLVVAKIRAEELRGTPLQPAGESRCAWRLDDPDIGGYPAEYVALANAITELDEERDAFDKAERSRQVTTWMMNNQ